mgnify:CR=1 FL=1
MKKLLVGLGFLTFFLNGCSSNSGSTEHTNETETTASQSQAQASSASTETNSEPEQAATKAVVYFSRSGKTQQIAETIQQQTNSDIFTIELVDTYPNNYSELLDAVQGQIDQGELPEIIAPELDLNRYDRIYLGSPIWFNDLSLPVIAWIEQTDLAGLEIVPFFTSGSSSYTAAQANLRALLPNATVLEGIGITDASRSNATTLVTNWVNTLN